MKTKCSKIGSKYQTFNFFLLELKKVCSHQTLFSVKSVSSNVQTGSDVQQQAFYRLLETINRAEICEKLVWCPN